MADFAKHRKDDLVKLLRKLDVHTVTKDTKKVLIEKIDAYIKTHADSEHKVHAALQEILDESDEEKPEVKSEVKESESSDSDSDSDSEKENDDDENDDDDEADEDDDDKDDEDYQRGPPIDIKEYVIDPLVKYYEAAHAKVFEFTDSVGITYLEYSDQLREKLSTTVTLSFLELLLEFAYFLYAFVPLVALKHNRLNLQVLKDNVPFFATSTLPTPELSVLLGHNVVSTFLQWVVHSIALPLAVSYYVNFSRRIVAIDDQEGFLDRIYTYDPFIFALSKVLIFYFFNVNGGSLAPAASFSGVLNSIKYYVLSQLGAYGEFTRVLGSFPLVLGLANVAIALYAQFENY